MSGSGIYDASGVLISEVGRNYVGGDGPDPVDRDTIIRTDLQYINNDKLNPTQLRLE